MNADKTEFLIINWYAWPAQPAPSSDLVIHVCDLCLFSYPYLFIFYVPIYNILLSIFFDAAISLFFAWLVSVYVYTPYVINRNTHQL